MKTYYLFIDESRDHGLAKLNAEFPVFLLCGILVQETNYINLDNSIKALKKSIWEDKDVILHSWDIRKCENEFQKLFDLGIKKQFYESLNTIIADSNYTIIASAIQKQHLAGFKTMSMK